MRPCPRGAGERPARRRRREPHRDRQSRRQRLADDGGAGRPDQRARLVARRQPAGVRPRRPDRGLRRRDRARGRRHERARGRQSRMVGGRRADRVPPRAWPTLHVPAGGGEPTALALQLPAGTIGLALAGDHARAAFVAPPLLVLPGVAELTFSLAGLPAWSLDAARLAFATAAGIATVGVARHGLAGAARRAGRRTRRRSSSRRRELRIVAAAGGASRSVLATRGVAAADWQPCARSRPRAASPRARRTARTAPSATTQADQPVDLPVRVQRPGGPALASSSSCPTTDVAAGATRPRRLLGQDSSLPGQQRRGGVGARAPHGLRRPRPAPRRGQAGRAGAEARRS